jgi:hypothetical protein
VRFVVELVHLVRRDASAKLDVLQFQITREPFQRRPLTAVACDDQPCFGKTLLDLRKRTQNARDVVQRIQVAVRQEDRQQRFSLFELEPIGVDDVCHRRSTQTKLPKNVDQILRRHDYLVSQSHDRRGRSRPRAKMILSLTAPIVQDDFLTEETTDNDRRRRRNQERQVRRREGVNYVVARDLNQQVYAIDERRDQSSHVLDGLQQPQRTGQTRIVRHERHFKIRFVTQVVEQVIRLHGLTTQDA